MCIPKPQIAHDCKTETKPGFDIMHSDSSDLEASSVDRSISLLYSVLTSKVGLNTTSKENPSQSKLDDLELENLEL